MNKDSSWEEGGKGNFMTQDEKNLNGKLIAPSIQDGHAIETYKSLINISLAGLKLLALLNGGAAVALLAFIGNISGKNLPVPDLRWSMAFFLGGLSLCGLAFFLSYLTQFILYQEVMNDKIKKQISRHIVWHRLASIIALLSLVAFIIGSFLAVNRFQSLATFRTSNVEDQLINERLKAE